MIIAIPWQACRQTRFGSRLAVVAMTWALLLTSSNLFAQQGVLGPTNVTTLNGGWGNNGANGPYYGYTDGITNTAAFDFPAGLALEPSGNSLFIADCTNNAVRWISNLKNSSFSQVYTFLYTNDGISLPVAVAVDGATNVYVLNRANGTNGNIMEFNANAFMFYNGQSGTEGPGVTIATHLTNATAMALDGLTNIYVTCNSNTVMRITPAGVASVVGVIATNSIATNGVNLRGVTGMDNGQLALTDAGNNSIWTMNLANGIGNILTGFHGAGDNVGPTNLAAFNHPENIAKADGGWLVVADRYNHKVKTIDASGNVYRLFGVRSNFWVGNNFPYYMNGLADGKVYSYETNYSVMAREPVGIAIAPDGSVYDTEVYYHVVRHVSSAAVPPLGFTNTNGVATTVPPLFNAPNGIALDRANANLYIADQSNNVVEQLNFAANTTTPYLNTNNNISHPVDVAVDSASDLYVLNQGTGGNGSILEFDRFQNPLATNALGLVQPTAMTLDNSGNIFVAEQGGAVQVFTNGVASGSNTLATVTAAGAQLQGIVILADGTIVVSDAGNDVIWQINPVTKAVSLFTGQVGVPGSTLGPTNFAKLNQPHKLMHAADSGNNELLVASDDGNNRLVVMNRSGAVTNVLNAINSIVWFGRTNDPVTPGSSRYVTTNSPVGLALDNAGSVYSSETFYDDIRKISNTGLFQYSSTTTTTNVTIGTNGLPVTNIVVNVPLPAITPNSGYYPMGQAITVNSQNPVYYTTDGSIPTINSTPVPMLGGVGSIRWFNTTNDLTLLHLVAINNGTNVSAVVSGLPVVTNSIGTPPGFNPNPSDQNIYAGIGSSIVIPVVCNLNSNSQIESFQFNYEIAPINNGNTPTLVPLNIIPTNDFVPLVTAAQTGFVATNTLVPYTHGTTNGLTVYAIGSGSHILFRQFAVIALLDVQIPFNANPGDTYSLNVILPSGSSDGYNQNVPLKPMAPATITVSDIPYTVGDSASDPGGGWYNAGTFGDDNLDNIDVNEVFYAASGLRVPYPFSDVFNAMDAYPVDTPGNPGGDGQIRFLDWNTILQRALGQNNNNWARAWSAGGNLVDVTTNLLRPAALYSSAGKIISNTWNKQALVGGISVGNVSPGGTVNMPVYVKMQYGSTLGGLQFRALVTPQNNAPVLANAPQFNPAAGVPSPSQKQSFKAGEAAFGWSLLPKPSFNCQSGTSNFLGYVSFTIPTNAVAGQIYTVSFPNADGAPDMNSQYDFETRSASVTVNGLAIPASVCSDEWKIYYFGSVTNPLAADTASPAGTGMPNWMAYLAGTDPTNPNSRFQISGLTKPKGQTQAGIQWQTAPGRAYELQWSTNLTGGAWNTLTTVIGNGAVTNCADTNTGGTTRYYRLHLLP
jgi:sugar lactone lactonase YvrE